MKIQNRKFFIEVEGFERYVYPDSSGYPTIGIGHLLTKSERTSGKIEIGPDVVRYRAGLTDDAVHMLFDQDIARFENAVNSGVKVALGQNQFDALVSFAFNVGVRAFKRSTLLRMLNQKKYPVVPVQLRRWKYSGGRVCKGLRRRRRKEINLWKTEDDR